MPFLIILVFCLVLFSSFLNTPKGKGWLGEFFVKRTLGKTKPRVRYVINDFKCRVSYDKTTQIDHILINAGGVFVIETKNYSGRIYGQEQSLEWTQVLSYGRVKNKLYNPIRQNKTHVYHISNLIGNEAPIVSAVVFVQGNINFIEARGVYTLRGLKALIKKTPATLSTDEMEAIYNKLIQANDDSITNREHVRNIKSIKTGIQNNVCPRCGKKLIQRHGKNGDFMGCEGYPACKFTKRI